MSKVYIHHQTPELYIYHQTRGWILTSDDPVYRGQYQKIKQLLDRNQGQGQQVEQNKYPAIITGPISFRILGLESHRFCTVVYGLQTNTKTQGVRYLVYGTKWNHDSDYGIGITLESIDVNKHWIYREPDQNQQHWAWCLSDNQKLENQEEVAKFLS